jgi:hypothetical protein
VSPPALLTVNPELQRNLWLELTATRLIAMPVAVFMVIGGAHSLGGGSAAGLVTKLMLGALLLLWGSRLAAEGLGDEVAARTWDVQRLSAASPWAMTLGKLVGGTVYVWYGALCCLPGLLLFEPSRASIEFESFVVAGLIAQGSGLLAALAIHQFAGGSRRGYTTFAQLVGLAAGGWGLSHRFIELSHTGEHIAWYGMNFPTREFVLVQQLAAVAWLAIGIMRSIRREFGYLDGPTAWTGFTLYAILLAVGFPEPGTATDWGVAWPLIQGGFVSAALTYWGLLVTPVSRARITRLRAGAASGRWDAVWRDLPIWVPSALAATVFTLALVADAVVYSPFGLDSFTLLAALGFLVRDIALVYLVRLTWRRRTLLGLVILFGLLYGLLPALTAGLGMTMIRQFFVPALPIIDRFVTGGLAPGFIAPWIEAALVGFLVWRRLRSIR